MDCHAYSLEELRTTVASHWENENLKQIGTCQSASLQFREYIIIVRWGKSKVANSFFDRTHFILLVELVVWLCRTNQL